MLLKHHSTIKQSQKQFNYKHISGSDTSNALQWCLWVKHHTNNEQAQRSRPCKIKVWMMLNPGLCWNERDFSSLSHTQHTHPCTSTKALIHTKVALMAEVQEPCGIITTSSNLSDQCLFVLSILELQCLTLRYVIHMGPCPKKITQAWSNLGLVN